MSAPGKSLVCLRLLPGSKIKYVKTDKKKGYIHAIFFKHSMSVQQNTTKQQSHTKHPGPIEQHIIINVVHLHGSHIALFSYR